MVDEPHAAELTFGQSIGAAGAPQNPIPILEANNFQVAPQILESLAENLEAEVEEVDYNEEDHHDVAGDEDSDYHP